MEMNATIAEVAVVLHDVGGNQGVCTTHANDRDTNLVLLELRFEAFYFSCSPRSFRCTAVVLGDGAPSIDPRFRAWRYDQ